MRERVGAQRTASPQPRSTSSPVMVGLGWWGLQHRPMSAPLRARAELLHDGGPEMWQDFMDELRERHLGVPKPQTNRPSVGARLDADYDHAINAAG